MTGYWRSLYYYIGWEYPEKKIVYDYRQRHLKYLSTQQLRKSDVKKLLKKRNNVKKFDERKEYVKTPYPSLLSRSSGNSSDSISSLDSDISSMDYYVPSLEMLKC